MRRRKRKSSISSLSQYLSLHTFRALAAETSNRQVQNLATQVEEKLQNGEFDGVGIESAEIVADELVITYTDGTVQNLGNVKGEQGPKGEKGDQGETPDVSGFVEKVRGNGHTYQVYAVGTSDNMYNDTTLTVEENSMFEFGFDYAQIPRRQGNGNLMTNTPVKDLDCANKKYVDDLIGDIEALLGGI